MWLPLGVNACLQRMEGTEHRSCRCCLHVQPFQLKVLMPTVCFLVFLTKGEDEEEEEEHEGSNLPILG